MEGVGYRWTSSFLWEGCMAHLYVLSPGGQSRPSTTATKVFQSFRRAILIIYCLQQLRATLRVHDSRVLVHDVNSRFRQLSIQNGSERIISLLRVRRVTSLKQRRGVQAERIKMSPREQRQSAITYEVGTCKKLLRCVKASKLCFPKYVPSERK